MMATGFGCVSDIDFGLFESCVLQEVSMKRKRETTKNFPSIV